MVAFYLPGGMPIYSYALILGLSAAIGLAWIAWQAPKGEVERRLDFGLWVLGGGLIGGRLAFLVAHASYLRVELLDLFAIFQGGLSWVGAVLGGMAVLLVYTRVRRVAMGLLADALIPLVATIIIGSWIGCWVDGCAYGVDVNTWWGYPAVDEWGRVSMRWPIQLVGAISTLGLLWIIESLPEMVSGARAALGLLAFSLVAFSLSFLRADPARVWNGFRLDTWATLVIASMALVLFLLVWLHDKYRRDRVSSA